MAARAFSSREFIRNLSAAKRAAAEGPVFITERGRPAFALLLIEDYRRLADPDAMSLLQLMNGIDGRKGIEFEAARLEDIPQSPELSPGS